MDEMAEGGGSSGAAASLFLSCIRVASIST